MAITALIAGLMLAQAAAPSITVEGEADRIEVAYQELAEGRNQAAIERIEAGRALAERDPSALINLGTAHVRLGRSDEARKLYYSAIASRIRYDLQLADGTWLDSRRAARRAIRLLETNRTLALR